MKSASALCLSAVFLAVVTSASPANATICQITCVRGDQAPPTTMCFDIFWLESECEQATRDMNHGELVCKYDWSYFGNCEGANRVSPVGLATRYMRAKLRVGPRSKRR